MEKCIEITLFLIFFYFIIYLQASFFIIIKLQNKNDGISFSLEQLLYDVAALHW